MKFMFMSQMFAGGDKNTFGGANANGMFSNPMMLMMMSGNGMGDMFEGLFDIDTDIEGGRRAQVLEGLRNYYGQDS